MGRRAADITGQVFGKWTVLRQAGKDSRNNVVYDVLCECGNEATVTGSSLRRGCSSGCWTCGRKSAGRTCTGKKAWNYNGGCRTVGSPAWANYRITSLKHDSTKRGYATPIGGADEVLILWQRCGGKCEICGEFPRNKRNLDLDHCHTTGKLRGFLCSRHNTSLHIIENYLTKAQAYLL